MGSSSFGLRPEDKEQVILEPFFLIKFHGGIDWDTYYNWPVAYKEWYLRRLGREMEKQNGTPETAKGTETPQRKINFQQLQNAFGGGDR